jgi:hypothetical protein
MTFKTKKIETQPLQGVKNNQKEKEGQYENWGQ